MDLRPGPRRLSARSLCSRRAHWSPSRYFYEIRRHYNSKSIWSRVFNRLEKELASRWDFFLLGSRKSRNPGHRNLKPSKNPECKMPKSWESGFWIEKSEKILHSDHRDFLKIPGIRVFFGSRDFNPWDSGFFRCPGILFSGFSQTHRDLCKLPGIRDCLWDILGIFIEIFFWWDGIYRISYTVYHIPTKSQLWIELKKFSLNPLVFYRYFETTESFFRY